MIEDSAKLTLDDYIMLVEGLKQQYTVYNRKTEMHQVRTRGIHPAIKRALIRLLKYNNNMIVNDPDKVYIFKYTDLRDIVGLNTQVQFIVKLKDYMARLGIQIKITGIEDFSKSFRDYSHFDWIDPGDYENGIYE